MTVREGSASDILRGAGTVTFATPATAETLKKSTLMKARNFAVQAHGDQPYGDKPYVEHLSAVVRVAEDFEASLNTLIAAWLHDVVEDTSVTVEEVSEKFGEQVANLVWAVSGEGHGNRSAHAASIYEKVAANPPAAFVKLADRIANIEACTVGDKHALRYSKEHVGFEQAIKPHVPEPMWSRYLEALKMKAA